MDKMADRKPKNLDPENSNVAKYWTSSYSTRALIEMQKVVDWAKNFVPTIDLPLLTFYVKNDPQLITSRRSIITTAGPLRTKN